MTRLDGEKTDTGRDTAGRFAPGNKAGPGRPRRETEREYLRTMAEVVTPERWRGIVEHAAAAAAQGDRDARRWLSDYLLGQPQGVAPTLHRLAVEDAAGTDAVQADADLDKLLGWP